MFFTIILLTAGCSNSVPNQAALAPELEQPLLEAAEQPEPQYEGLKGEWCYVKKRRVTRYNVADDRLSIRSGRSGQFYQTTLSCDDAYTECQAQTTRGWGTPVTEILKLDGDKMQLTRLWGGAWKNKAYHFTYSRCPRW